MRLIQCHIENFGKLRDVSFSFDKNCQVICEENGWGKTTLATFLRVMFFGFNNEGKRDEADNERKHYMPWQKGNYGGSVTFEVSGRRYIITRQFAKREKDDVFELRLADTNMVKDDYSSRIGEELFQIDRESFQRTVFVSQQQCHTMVTDAINAKMGNLVDNTDDMNNFATVYDKLKKKTDRMSPTRKTGTLHKLKTNIKELEFAIAAGQDIAVRMDETERGCLEQREKSQNIQRELNAREEKQKQLAGELDIQKERTRYASLCDIWQEEKENVREACRHFPDNEKIPSKEDVREWQRQEKQCRQLFSHVQQNALAREEEEQYEQGKQYFANKMLSEAFWKQMENQIQKLQQLRRWVADSRMEEAECKESLLTQKARMAAWKQQNTGKKNVGFLIMLIGVILTMFGVAGFLWQTVVGGIGVIIGVIILFAGVGVKKKMQNAKRDESSQERQLTEQISKIENILSSIQEKQEEYLSECAKIATEVSHFLSKYAIMPTSEEEFAVALAKLHNKMDKWQEWDKKKENYQKAKNAYEEQYEELVHSLSEFGYEPGDDREQMLQNMFQYVNEYESAKQRYQQVNEKKESYEKEHRDCLSALSQKEAEVTDANAMTQLTEEINLLRKKKEDTDYLIGEYEKRLQEDGEKWDDILQQKTEWEDKMESYQAEYKKYNLLCQTMTYLQKAKESLTARYMGPVKKGFDKYYEKIAEQLPGNYHFDAEVNLTVEEQGMQRSTRFLSEGYQDLTGICTRMALIEAMYKEEKPFLIFDDPFVNLDAGKTERAIQLLQEISREYQVIYFTCHETRSVSGQ